MSLVDPKGGLVDRGVMQPCEGKVSVGSCCVAPEKGIGGSRRIFL